MVGNVEEVVAKADRLAAERGEYDDTEDEVIENSIETVEVFVKLPWCGNTILVKP